jgi:hypothetical protein
MPIDLFARMRPNAALHPQFLKTRDDPQMAPARAMLRDVVATMEDPDGNLVEQFQSHGFDARTFEIYLHALFGEAGHTIDRSHDRPDFLISCDGLTVAVEAVTANPPPGKDYQPYQIIPANPPRTREEIFRYLKHEVAIKFGSPLYSKLQKRYWELPHVAGRPLILAIETFHGGALQHSATSVSQYLFGIDHSYGLDGDGLLVVEGEAITEHVGSKRIPSNFFGQPDAEHVSAVLFCNAGTIPKFARLGHQGGHRSRAVRMIRYGTCLDHDPNATEPEQFAYEVGDPEVPPEPWRDGSVLIHNPNALHPLPAEWLGASGEENLQPGGTVALTWRDPFQPFESLTMMFPGDESEEAMWRKVEIQMRLRAMGQAMASQWRG